MATVARVTDRSPTAALRINELRALISPWVTLSDTHPSQVGSGESKYLLASRRPYFRATHALADVHTPLSTPAWMFPSPGVAGLPPQSAPPFRAAPNAPQIHHHNDQLLRRLVHHFPRTHLTRCRRCCSRSFSRSFHFCPSVSPCHAHMCQSCVLNRLQSTVY